MPCMQVRMASEGIMDNLDKTYFVANDHSFFQCVGASTSDDGIGVNQMAGGWAPVCDCR